MQLAILLLEATEDAIRFRPSPFTGIQTKEEGLKILEVFSRM